MRLLKGCGDIKMFLSPIYFNLFGFVWFVNIINSVIFIFKNISGIFEMCGYGYVTDYYICIILEFM